MLTRGHDALARGARRRSRSRCYKASSRSRPDTEDAYRKLALVYWRTGRPRSRSRRSRRRSERRHAERSARSSWASTWREAGPGRARRIALLERRRGRSGRADCARQRLRRSRAGSPTAVAHVHAPARARSGQRPRLREPRHGAAAGAGPTRRPRRRCGAPSHSIRRSPGAYTALGVVLARPAGRPRRSTPGSAPSISTAPN